MSKLKVALVHDYINEFGGAERVLFSLSKIYPNAPIYTIYIKQNSSAAKYFNNKKIIQSWFASLPFADKLISPLRFFIPLIWNSFDFKEYDLVITSSAWAVTKGMRNAKLEISYVHTPPRYLYGYDTSRNWKTAWFAGLVKFYALIVNHFMRLYDFNQSQKPDILVANSKNIAKRIKKFYRRKSAVIYPPVSLKTSKLKTKYKNYYLAGGRLVKHKNFDKIIKAFNKLDEKLIIFGSGSLESYLKNIASKNVIFVGKVNDEELFSLYKNAKAFIVASKDEDFGMTPIEAAIMGTPTIAYKAEGYLETVIEGKTGLFFDKLSTHSIRKAVQLNESKKWNKKTIKNHAKKFSEERFKKEISKIVKSI